MMMMKTWKGSLSDVLVSCEMISCLSFLSFVHAVEQKMSLVWLRVHRGFGYASPPS